MEVQSYLPTPPKRCIWLLRMNKLKAKYNVLAQCNLERLLLSTALLAIYITVVPHLRKTVNKFKNLSYFENSCY